MEMQTQEPKVTKGFLWLSLLVNLFFLAIAIIIPTVVVRYLPDVLVKILVKTGERIALSFRSHKDYLEIRLVWYIIYRFGLPWVTIFFLMVTYDSIPKKVIQWLREMCNVRHTNPYRQE